MTEVHYGAEEEYDRIANTDWFDLSGTPIRIHEHAILHYMVQQIEQLKNQVEELKQEVDSQQ